MIAVNLPVAIPYRENWDRFFELNSERAIDWGTLWYIGRYLDGKWNSGVEGDRGPFQWLSGNIPTLNYLSYALFGLACLGVAALALLAPRRPRLAQLAFLVVAAFLIFSKVWSQQFVLWLLPLAVLARPRWGAFLTWQFAEVCYFLAFYGELLGLTPVGRLGNARIACFTVGAHHILLCERAATIDHTFVEDPKVHHSFTVSPETLVRACKVFRERQIRVEHLYHRQEGVFPGRELYFFDPSGNRLELRDPTWHAGMPEPTFEELATR